MTTNGGSEVTEPYADLFAAMVNQAKNDILFAPLGSKDFYTAAKWMLVGWGFEVISRFAPKSVDFRKHWIEVIESRRRDATEGRGDGRCSFFVP